MKKVLCIFAALLILGSCNKDSSHFTQAFSKPTPPDLLKLSLREAESSLGVNFDKLDRQDFVNGQKIFVYTQKNLAENEARVYLTISQKDGWVGWSSSKIENGKLFSTAKFPSTQLEANSFYSTNSSEIRTISTELKDVSRKFGSVSDIDSVILPQEYADCTHCAQEVYVPGHYVEDTIMTKVITWATAAGCAGIANVAGQIICVPIVTEVVNKVMRWVPPYSYCNRWAGYGSVCPTVYNLFFDKMFASLRRRFVA